MEALGYEKFILEKINGIGSSAIFYKKGKFEVIK